MTLFYNEADCVTDFALGSDGELDGWGAILKDFKSVCFIAILSKENSKNTSLTPVWLSTLNLKIFYYFSYLR